MERAENVDAYELYPRFFSAGSAKLISLDTDFRKVCVRILMEENFYGQAGSSSGRQANAFAWVVRNNSRPCGWCGDWFASVLAG
jgi:hypothetical protein